MHAKDALKLSMKCGDDVALAYLEDLTDAEMFHRPCPGANHINWQLGHLIASENHHVSVAAPSAVRPLPPGFAEKYTTETSQLDDPQAFCTKAELMQLAKEQRAATLAALDSLPDAELDRPTGIEWAPTVAALFAVEGGHWLMHAGQWTVIRRQLGRKPLF
jgi:hypothetical protein